MRIYNYTTIFPGLTKDLAVSDIPMLFQGKGTQPENLIEYAGRVCYKSTDKMGHNPTFIAQRMKEGHTDIAEHVYVTVEIDKWDAFIHQFDRVRQTWLDVRRFFSVNDYRNNWYVTGNLRAWHQLCQEFYSNTPEVKIVQLMQQISPQLFGEPVDDTPLWTAPPLDSVPFIWNNHTGTPQRISLIGLTIPIISELPERYMLNSHSATFLIEGVSRSLTHQLVRHRLLSFSQESQRYVSLEKGKWDFIKPPAFETEEDETMWQTFGEVTSAAYRHFKARYKQEDARFVLPNATESRLVVSGPLIAWDNFLEQRTPKAAQWEIRGLATKITTLLCQIGLDYFNKYL